MCRSLHKTSFILDAMRTGRDWPVMWRTRKCEVVLQIDANAVNQDLAYVGLTRAVDCILCIVDHTLSPFAPGGGR